MDSPDWQTQFPDVPESIHRTIVNTLEGLEERNGNHMKNRKNKKRGKSLLLIAAVLAAALGTTALAAEIFRWNERAKEVFVADEAAQNRLVSEGNVTGIDRTVTDEGITMELIQTIQDEHYFYALFHVTVGDGVPVLDEDSGLAMELNPNGGENPFTSLEWGFVSNAEQAPGSSRYFEINGTKMEGAAMESGELEVVFTELQQNQKNAGAPVDLKTGSWAFTIDMKQTSAAHFTPDKEYSLGDSQVKVLSVDLSPLSITITCDGQDIRRMEERAGISSGQTDLPQDLVISGIRYQDGTVVSQGFGVKNYGYSGQDGAFELIQRFTAVVDTEKAQAILMGEGQDEILLK